MLSIPSGMQSGLHAPEASSILEKPSLFQECTAKEKILARAARSPNGKNTQELYIRCNLAHGIVTIEAKLTNKLLL